MKKIVYATIIFVCWIASGHAQQSEAKAELLGHVIDKTSGEHLPYISLFLKETNASASSDESGHFRFSDLVPGKYTLVASMVGYGHFERKIELGDGSKLDITIALESNAEKLNAVIVSADRGATLRKESTSVVNVLTPLLLENTNSQVLSDGLSFVSGLRVENNCQNCGYRQVRINGLDGQYSQILIDGRPIVSALAGVYGVEQIPSGMIERIEVVRGGGSALYGAGAVGGVVNIVTKEATNNSGTLSYNLSMLGGKAVENNFAANFSLSAPSGKTGAYVFANVRNRNPYDYDDDEYTELPELAGGTVGFRAYNRPNKFSKITLEYHNITEKRRGGNKLNLPPHEADIAEQLEHAINGGGIKYDLFSNDGKHKAKLYASAQHTERDSYYGTGKNPNAYGYTSGLTVDAGGTYSYSFDRLLFMPAVLTGGAEYNYDALNDETAAYNRITRQNVRTASMFLLNEWKNDRFDILLSARLDKHDMIDRAVFSPRLNFKYNLNENIVFRANYSEGFLAPQTFSEDLHILAAGGNLVLIRLSPELKPEHSRGFGFSADLYRSFGKIQTNLLIEGFNTALRDVFVLENVGTDENGNVMQEKRNGSGASVRGVNLEAKMSSGTYYQFQVGLTLQKSEYDEPEKWSDNGAPASKNMFRTPNLYGYFTGRAKIVSGLSISTSGTYTGRMYVQHLAGYIPNDRLEKTHPFFDIGIKLSYDFKLKSGLTAQLNAGVSNVFDAYQNDFDMGPDRDSGYIYGPMAPRSYFVGVKFTL